MPAVVGAASAVISFPRRPSPLPPQAERLERRALLALGGLDPTFGDGGRVYTSFPLTMPDLSRRDEATCVAATPEGKVVLVGISSPTAEGAPAGDPAVALVRYNSDGTPDPGFGDGGTVLTSLPTFGRPSCAVPPDGKVLVATEDGAGGILVARYRADGTPDPTFGDGGFVADRFPSPPDASDFSDGPTGLALQPDGRIVVSGSIALLGPDGPGDRDFAVARYRPDGRPDASFGRDGKAVFDLSGGDDIATSLALQNDGKILIAGSSRGDVALARLTRGGHMDRSFGNKGRLFTEFGGTDRASAVAVRPDGRIVIAGTTASLPDAPRPYSDIILGRYLPDGRRDGGFGGDGRVTYSFVRNDAAPSLLLQPGGKAVVAADTVARFDAAGRLDRSFGDNGRADVGFLVRDLTNAARGKLIAAGGIEAGGTFGDLAAARLTAGGRADRSFGRRGVATADLRTPNFARPIARSVDVGRDGSIVVGGVVETLAGGQLALAHYRPDGRLDRRFGDGGRVADPALTGVNDVVVQGDGKVLVASNGAVLRRNADGTPDPTFGEGGSVAGFGAERVAVLPGGVIATPSSLFTPAGSFLADLDSTGAWNFGDLAAQPDGRLVRVFDSLVCGGGDDGPTCLASEVIVNRNLPDGRLDPSFDGDGMAMSDLGATEPDGTDERGGFPKAVTVQRDGKIVVAGRFVDGPASGDPDDGPIVTQLLVLRYNRDGSLDDTFGRGGVVLRDFPPPTDPDMLTDDEVVGVSVGPDGEVAVALPGGIVALTANGGSGRFVRSTPFAIAAIARQGDGKLVVAGTSDKGFGLARFVDSAAGAV